MKQDIKANFKQATVKAGVAVLQFEVLSSVKGFNDVLKMAGNTVVLTVQTEQQELPLDDVAEGQTTINNFYINDGGEIAEQEAEVVEEAYLLPEGGEE